MFRTLYKISACEAKSPPQEEKGVGSSLCNMDLIIYVISFFGSLICEKTS